jgi:metal-sulfur cluster biosynthetic enzyme
VKGGTTMPTPEIVRKALRAVKDPELNLNIIDIGLVYDIAVSDEGHAHVQMTLTSPGCPSGAEIMEDARRVVTELDGVTGVEIELVWEPFWTPERMDPRVKAFLGY